MFRFKRPDKPSGFDAAVKDAKAKIQKKIDAKEKLKDEDFDAVWRDFTKIYLRAQHGRCGFCDARVTATHTGHLDHYRPKSELAELSDDQSTWGKEITAAPHVRGRSKHRTVTPGYWWLAYAWDNYVYACERCNVSWKRTFFPVAEGQARKWPPEEGAPDTPLLLHCYSAEDPKKHLRFNADGSVEAMPGSVHGWETRKTCGLYREQLRIAREEKANRAYYIAERLKSLRAEGLEGSPAWTREVEDLKHMGTERFDFAGVVRIIVEQELEMTWEELRTTL